MIPLLGAWEAVKPFRAWIFGGLALIALLVGLWLALDAYGDRRYAEGRDDNERAWKAAEAKLRQEEKTSAAGADKAAIVREEAHAAAVASEKGKIDAAMREGSSPLDVLFGNASGVCAGQAGSCKPSGSR